MFKYPRTPHLPWSQGGTIDDVRLVDVASLQGKQIIYTEKLDGECTVMSHDDIHARSVDGHTQPWQTYVKSKWAEIKHLIPVGMYICGENMYAVHSIEYKGLTSYFYVFGIVYNGVILSWKETKVWTRKFGLATVPVLVSKVPLQKYPIPDSSTFGKTCEGYVVRNIESFPVEEFHLNVAKCVRPNHVTTDEHWSKNWKVSQLAGQIR